MSASSSSASRRWLSLFAALALALPVVACKDDKKGTGTPADQDTDTVADQEEGPTEWELPAEQESIELNDNLVDNPEQPGDEPSDEPDVPTDLPGDEPHDLPGDDPADQPGDDPADQPGDDPADQPGDNPGDTPVEQDTPACTHPPQYDARHGTTCGQGNLCPPGLECITFQDAQGQQSSQCATVCTELSTCDFMAAGDQAGICIDQGQATTCLPGRQGLEPTVCANPGQPCQNGTVTGQCVSIRNPSGGTENRCISLGCAIGACGCKTGDFCAPVQGFPAGQGICQSPQLGK